MSIGHRALPERTGAASSLAGHNPGMTPRYLGVLNAGSSSVKFAIRRTGTELPLAFSGQVEAIGVAPHLEFKDSGGTPVRGQNWPPARFDHRTATPAILTLVQTPLGSRAIA